MEGQEVRVLSILGAGWVQVAMIIADAVTMVMVARSKIYLRFLAIGNDR